MNETKQPKVNYQAVVVPFSWWKDIKDRRWVIISRQYEIKGDHPNLEFHPDSVTLLQELASEPVVRPWKDIVDLIEAGKFTRILHTPAYEMRF